MNAGKKKMWMTGCCVGFLLLSQEAGYAVENETTEYLEETELCSENEVCEEKAEDLTEVVAEEIAEEAEVQVLDLTEETQVPAETETPAEDPAEIADPSDCTADTSQTEGIQTEPQMQSISYDIADQRLESGKTFEDIVVPECAVAEDGSEVDGEVQWKIPGSEILLDADMELCGADGESQVWEWTFLPEEQEEYEPAEGSVKLTLYAAKESPKSIFSGMFSESRKEPGKASSSGSSTGSTNVKKLPPSGDSSRWMGSVMTGVGKIGSNHDKDAARQVEEKLTIAHGTVRRKETEKTKETADTGGQTTPDLKEEAMQTEPKNDAKETDNAEKGAPDAEQRAEIVRKTGSDAESVRKASIEPDSQKGAGKGSDEKETERAGVSDPDQKEDTQKEESIRTEEPVSGKMAEENRPDQSERGYQIWKIVQKVLEAVFSLLFSGLRFLK